MRLITFVVLLSVTGVADLGGQQAAPPELRRELPSDVVARLAREALSSPAEPATWKALAASLPDLALLGEAELEGTLDAARIADSLAAAADAVATLPEPALREEAGSVPQGDVGVMGGGAVVLLLALLVYAARARRRRTAARPPRPAGAGRAWSARTLATGGLPVREIAKRTGMAREAVDLALNLGGASPRPTPPRQPRPARPGGEAALQASLKAGVRGLRDRRLTYGGGVS